MLKCFQLCCFALLFASSALSQEGTAESSIEEANRGAREAFLGYLEALSKRDLSGALKLTATFPDLPADHIAKRTKGFIESFSVSRPKDFDLATLVLAEREKGSCAVLAVQDSRSSTASPAFLLKQNGSWKVLLDFSSYTKPEFKLSNSERAEFETLEKWFQSNKEKWTTQLLAKNSKQLKINEENLIGYWRSGIFSFRFEEEGTFYGGVLQGGQSGTFKGEWKLVDGAIHWNYKSHTGILSVSADRKGKKDVNPVIFLSQKGMVLKEDDGSTTRWKRTTESDQLRQVFREGKPLPGNDGLKRRSPCGELTR